MSDDRKDDDDLLFGDTAGAEVQKLIKNDPLATEMRRLIRQQTMLFVMRVDELTNDHRSAHSAAGILLLEGACRMLRGVVPDKTLPRAMSGFARGMAENLIEEAAEESLSLN